MARSDKKLLGTNILVERDQEGFFIVSIPGIQGAHADGKTFEKAMKNLGEVISLLKAHHGEKIFLRMIKKENRYFGVVPYDLEYV